MTTPAEREPLLAADAVAEWLSVPRLRVYEMARTGELPAVRLGRSIRFDPARVREWIDEGGTAANGDDSPGVQ
jgi:excisionase family DNA binding protein